MAALSPPPHRHPLLLLPTRKHFPNPLTRSSFFTGAPSPSLRRSSTVARLIPSGQLPDFDSIDVLAHQLLGRAEGIVYTLADAAVSTPAAAAQDPNQNGDWLSGITGYMETVLKVLKDGLSALHVPYSYGFAIILLTVLVKAATFPLSKKQVESALAMRSLQPQVKAIQQRYAGDQERIQLEIARLYKLAGVNPLAGCLPTLATIPVWIGLYRALSNVANEGLLNEGFFWIPSLAGPTTVAARQSGSGTSWIFNFVDGQPPLGWPDTIAYLVLPVLLVVSQYISTQIMQPSQDTDSNQQSTQIVTKILPLMIGYFALSVPSGLSLYWLTNNILSTAQQIWFQKLGGAKSPVKQYSDRTYMDEPSSISASEVKKPVLGTETEEVKPSQAKKVDSGGLRPGERFKQLKEQEARMRKQREEEKSKSEETSASSSITIEQESTEARSVENNDKQDSENRWREPDTSASTNGGLNYHANSILKDERCSHEKVHKGTIEATIKDGGQQRAATPTGSAPILTSPLTVMVTCGDQRRASTPMGSAPVFMSSSTAMVSNPSRFGAVEIS